MNKAKGMTQTDINVSLLRLAVERWREDAAVWGGDDAPLNTQMLIAGMTPWMDAVEAVANQMEGK